MKNGIIDELIAQATSILRDEFHLRDGSIDFYLGGVHKDNTIAGKTSGHPEKLYGRKQVNFATKWVLSAFSQ